MAATASHDDGRKLREREAVRIDFDKVALTCSYIWMCAKIRHVQAALIPLTVEMGDEDVAIKHLCPRQ